MENKSDIPLDRDENIQDEQLQSDQKSEKADDEPMSDADSKSESNPED